MNRFVNLSPFLESTAVSCQTGGMGCEVETDYSSEVVRKKLSDIHPAEVFQIDQFDDATFVSLNFFSFF